MVWCLSSCLHICTHMLAYYVHMLAYYGHILAYYGHILAYYRHMLIGGSSSFFFFFGGGWKVGTKRGGPSQIFIGEYVMGSVQIGSIFFHLPVTLLLSNSRWLYGNSRHRWLYGNSRHRWLYGNSRHRWLYEL